ncbi:MAG: alginate lyase family protein, partial [Candidatus Latescibacteria bacterium]|nr:alginate lyase family protein [Candidatus Latescibacterota bacterium]
ASCVRLLADRMRSKPHPSFSPYRTPAEGPVDPEAESTADDILAGVFTLTDGKGGTLTKKLTGDFEWSPSYEGTEVYYPPKAFRYALNQHEPLTTLARVYWKTEETRYRNRLLELLMDWIRRVPTYWELLPSNDLVRQHWQNMNTRNRFEKWLHFYPLFASALTDRDAVDLLKAMINHARLMNRYVEENIGGRISATLSGMMKVNLKFALLFPEASESATCIEVFRRHFRTGIDAAFYPDGGLKYRCPGYHAAVSPWYVQGVELADEIGIAGIDYEREMTRKMNAYIALISKPDGSLPLLGDTGLSPNETGWREKLAVLQLEAPSVRLEWSGLYAMRSGWEREALYLFFTAGPHGIMHNHQDHLSFQISGYGTHLLVEPGLTPYGRTEQRRIWSQSPAHSTLSVDGLGQHRTHVDPSGPSEDPWYSCPEFDFAEGRFSDGFGPDHSLKVDQLRSILFVKPDYFLVIDQVLGQGDHSLNWHFMFYPQSLEVDRSARRAVSNETGTANVSFSWSDPDLDAELIVGEMEPPYRGLMTGDRPAPSLFLARQAELPLSAAFLAEPVRSGASPTLTLDRTGPENGLTFTVHGAEGAEDRVLLGPGTTDSNRVESDGKVTLIRLDAGRPVAAMVAGASEATFDGTPIQDLDIPVRWL